MNKQLTVHDTKDDAIARLTREGFDVSVFEKPENANNTRTYIEKKDERGSRVATAQMDKIGNQFLVVVK